MSCGHDGCLYGWEVRGGNRTIEHASKANAYECFVADRDCDNFCVATREGDLRLIKGSDGSVSLDIKGDVPIT